MIELASIRTTGDLQEVRQGNVNQVWMATVEAESGQYNAYIKKISTQSIFTESVCAMAGRKLGLDIPKPFIVSDGKNIMFGCEDVGFDSFKQFVDKGDQAAALALASWCGLHDAVIFDEWIANGDRNQGNFLYNGDGSFTLIDHERALGSEDWEKNGLKHAETNQFYNVIQSLGDIEKKKLRNNALASEALYQSLDKDGICHEHRLTRLFKQEKRQDVLDFLNENADNLACLIDERVGIRQLF